jgi:Fe2+ or Zn2+ uptake regulation protein
MLKSRTKPPSVGSAAKILFHSAQEKWPAPVNFGCPREGVRRLINSRKDLQFVQVSAMANYTERLRNADLRVTRPRIAVLHSVHQNPHSDTETIIRLVRDCVPDVSRQAVYDVLHALTDAGLLRRVQPSGWIARYESRVGDNHHHTVCRTCGFLADVDCAVGDTLCLNPSDANGFRLDQTEVIYWGLCPDCWASDEAQANGANDPTAQVPDQVPYPSDNPPPTHGIGQPVPAPPAASAGWLAAGPLAPITVLKATGIGTGGLGANAGWARYDVADATVVSNGPGNEPSVPHSVNFDVK